MLRHFAPYVLLAAYLPIAAMSSLHVHHDTVDHLDDCGRCDGHYDEPHHHQSDCQYCTFLSLSYLAQGDDSTEIVFPADRLLVDRWQDAGVQCHYGVARLRAPPAA